MNSSSSKVDPAGTPAGTAAPSDAHLLGDFLRRRDDGAFEALVRRHGPLVLGVCRRVLQNEEDAADAFQAVFLVLARKAVSVRAGGALGTWLYQVAYRTALKARAVRAKRKARERQVSAMPAVAIEAAAVDDVLAVLDEELHRLPEKYQQSVILCDLQGKSRAEVAAVLGVAVGTLSSRLATAHKKLADSLRRRGVAVSGAALATLLAQNAVSAGVPPALVAATIQAAAAPPAAAGLVATQVLALADAVARGMLLSKLKLAAGAVLVALLLAGTIALLATQNEEPPDRQARALAALRQLGARVFWETRPAGKEVVRIDLGGTRVRDDHVALLPVFNELENLGLEETAVTDAACPAIGSLPGLQTLRLNQTPISDAGLKPLAGVPRLRNLRLSGTKVTDAGLKELAGHGELAELDLRQTLVSDTGLKELATLRRLETLDLGSTRVSDAGLKDLAVLPALSTLRLGQTTITDAGTKTVATLDTLTALSFERNRGVTDAGIADLARLPRLGSLNLGGTAVTDAGIPALAAAPALRMLRLDQTPVTGNAFAGPNDFRALETLSLIGAKVSDATLGPIAALTSLRGLELGHTAVSDAGVRKLASLRRLASLSLMKSAVTDDCVPDLGVMPALSALDLGETAVTDAGLKRVAELVQTGQGFLKLRELSLHQTAVTDAGVAHLATLRPLHTLCLSSTALTDDGLKAAAALQSLRTLRLGGCKVSDAGLAALRPLVNLRELWLDRTPITDAGLRELAPMKDLEEVHLEGTAVSAAAREAFAVRQWIAQAAERRGTEAAAAEGKGEPAVPMPLEKPVAGAAEASVGLVRVLKGHTGSVRDLRFTPDGRKLISVSGWPGKDHSVRIWDLATGRELHRIAAPGQLNAVELSADGRFALTGTIGAVLRVDMETGEVVSRFKGFHAFANSVSLSPDGRHAYSASGDGFARRWRLEEAQEVGRFRVAGKIARFAAELPNGRLVTVDNERLVQLWDVATAQEVSRFPAETGWFSSAALAPGGRHLLVGHVAVTLWDLATGDLVRTFEGHGNEVPQISVSPDGKTLATASFDGTVRLWDFQSGAQLQVRSAREEFQCTAVFSPDGRMLAVAGGGRKEGKDFRGGIDHDIRLIDLTSAPPAAVAQDVSAEPPLPARQLRRWILLVAAVTGPILIAVFLLRRLRPGAGELSPAGPAPPLGGEVPASPIVLACHACGKNLKVRPHLAGKQAKCPACGAGTLVP